MNEQEFRMFRAKRIPSPQLGRFDQSKLHCYGCAHSASNQPFPSGPSGERPCCSCIRNKERCTRTEGKEEFDYLIDDQGHAHNFDPFLGALYNGAPTVYFPQDNYVTLDQLDQDAFMANQPEY